MYDSSEIHLQECKYISVSVQGASVSLWSKSSCQHKAYSSQIWFQRCFCCCINPLFVLNLTYPHSCSYPPTPPLSLVRGCRRMWRTGLTLHVFARLAGAHGVVWPFHPTWKDVLSSSVIGGRMWARSHWLVFGIADWGARVAITWIHTNLRCVCF